MKTTTIEIEEVAVILKLLGDKTRLTMMKILDGGACCVCEFVEIFQMTQPAISQHLRRLKDMGLVQEEKKGQWVFYSINENNVYYPFVTQILNQLPSQKDKLEELEKQGKRISCC
ncbi:ArsR/SmtB family transcription factor [Niallia circulans]|uniref:ArsR/SmtB family transcription factor n=1 Tax=Niallia circulans TaxID=1397 RepID=UPI001F1A5D95|nr:metalloregulator ArsR/SmtB family transcription factor [Niallia circulans]MCF2649709.1 helix-turn-helix transcriptional regulator [Niallia circulans]